MLKKRHLIAISSDRIQTRYNTSGVEIDKMLRRTGDRLASNIPKATKQWMYEERKKKVLMSCPPTTNERLGTRKGHLDGPPPYKLAPILL